MRIKIVGKVTADRLVKAFEEAARQFSNVKGGLVLSGANIYFNAFDNKGVMYDLVEDDGQQVIIEQMPESQEQEFNLNRNVRKKSVKISTLTEKIVASNRAKSVKSMTPEQAAAALDEITDALIEYIPDNFLYILNSFIKEEFSFYKRIISVPTSDCPEFVMADIGLQLTSDSWSRAKIVNRPWFSARRDLGLSVTNHYDYETGLENGIIELMQCFVCYLNEDIIRTLDLDVFAKKNIKMIYSLLFMENLKFIESRLDYLSSIFHIIDEICIDIMRLSGSAFIDKINSAIALSWEEANLAKPPPMPIFDIDDLYEINGFVVTSSSWKTARNFKNPLRKLNSQDAYPLWNNKPWSLAEDKIKDIIICECINLKLPYPDPKELVDSFMKERVDTYDYDYFK